MRTLLAFTGGFALAHIYHTFVAGGILVSLNNNEFGIGPSSIRGDYYYQPINDNGGGGDDDNGGDDEKSSGNVDNGIDDDEQSQSEGIREEDHKNGGDVDVGVVKNKHAFLEEGTNISSDNVQKSNSTDATESENAENDGTSDNGDSNSNSNDNITNEPESICDALQHQSPMKIWTDHLNPIFHASRHLLDREDQYIWHDFTAQLLNYMTPQRLATSVKALPFRQWDQVEHILKVVWERYAYYLKINDADAATAKTAAANVPVPPGPPPRKLNILVMGGSVTMGVICKTNPVERTTRFGRRSCAWPTRLEQFLNALFSFSEAMVQVHVLTLGGTNTKSATTIWDYNLFPPDMPHPDIVIHGYATNDMHVSTVADAMNRNVTLEDLILEMNQKFIRQVLKPSINVEDHCHRPTPLLLYYDDYIGNEQKEILSTNSFTQAISTLSSYYGLGFMSYANAVKHLTYGDWKEDWFSPNAWPDRQIHPGMGMHISSIWVVAFNFLNTASVFCERLLPEPEEVVERNNTDTDAQDNMVGDVHDHDNNPTLPLAYIASHGLPALRDPGKDLAGAPILPPDGSIPPELMVNLTLDNISSQWQKDANSAMKFSALQCHEHEHEHGHSHSKSGQYVYRPCIYSWIGNMERSFDKVQHMDTRINPFLVTSSDTGGWEANMDYGKLGYAANKEEAMFDLKFENITQTVKTLNFMVMTSYGKKWDGSKVLVEAFVDVNQKGDGQVDSLPIAEPRATMEIAGQHEKETSETYNHKLVFEDGLEAQVDNTLRIRVKLVGGSTFKFMGMAFCDH
uniref:SGNH hydrolase-type esterase domain-containing protein n=1 Tax=Chaetoceros debilis TaxID=122233 RepID=A0A7S3VCV0_9STRA